MDQSLMWPPTQWSLGQASTTLTKRILRLTTTAPSRPLDFLKRVINTLILTQSLTSSKMTIKLFANLWVQNKDQRSYKNRNLRSLRGCLLPRRITVWWIIQWLLSSYYLISSNRYLVNRGLTSTSQVSSPPPP